MPPSALAGLVVVAVVTLLARRAVTRPAWRWLRALLPAWRFFDRAIASPRLLVRFAAPGAALGPWTGVEAAPRGLAGWAFAPAGNLALACQAAVDQLVADLGELDLEDTAGSDGSPAIETAPEVLGLVSYALVARIARAHAPAGAQLQWKIVVPAALAPVDYLLSPVAA